MNLTKEVYFECIPVTEVYNKDDFKIYGCRIDTTKYPNIHLSEYKTCTIMGDFQKLVLHKKYNVLADEKIDKRGVSYVVKSISRNMPCNLKESKIFLEEFISSKKVDAILNVYPNIIKMVINGDTQNIDLSKIKGVKEKTFNKLKKKIEENFIVSEIISEFKGLIKMSTAKKLVMKYKSINGIRKAFKKDPYKCFCELDGFGFKKTDAFLLNLYDKLKDTKDNILLFDDDLKTSYCRIKSCINYILEKNENFGNTYMDTKNLKSECLKLCLEAISHFEESLLDIDFFYDSENKRISRFHTHQTEKYIAEELLKRNSKKTKWLNCNYSKYNSLDGIPLTEEQCLVTKYICENNIVILNGFGGTGKSFSIKALINMLVDYNKRFSLLAPTGRAAKVLSAYTNKQAKTIHSALLHTEKYNTENQEYESEEFLYGDIIIIDEFSMVDIFLLARVLRAMDSEQKLLVIGDDAQLPSVGAGNVLHDMLKSNIFPTITLNKVFRYGVGGLSTVATNTRLGKEYLKESENKVQVFGEDKGYAFASVSQDYMIDYATKIYHKLLKLGSKPEDIIVLSAYNVGNYGTDVINKKIQNIVNPNSKKYIQYKDTQFRLNDTVLNTQNNYDAIKYKPSMIYEYLESDNCDFDYDNIERVFIANGEIGKITKIFNNNLVINFDGIEIIMNYNELNTLKLGYAISVHKSQGGSFKYVILLTPKAHTFNTNANLLYVGISRAKVRCYHIGEIQTINNALKKKENFDRKTILKDLLKKV